MKLSYILPALLSASVCSAFSVVPSTQSKSSSSQLQAEMGRREMVAAAGLTASALLVPQAAFAEYVPKVDDMKQIYCKYLQAKNYC